MDSVGGEPLFRRFIEDLGSGVHEGYVGEGTVNPGGLLSVLSGVQITYVRRELVSAPKILSTHIQDDWVDDRSRLCKTPFDLLPLVISKLKRGSGWGVFKPHRQNVGLGTHASKRMSYRMEFLPRVRNGRITVMELGEASINGGW